MRSEWDWWRLVLCAGFKHAIGNSIGAAKTGAIALMVPLLEAWVLGEPAISPLSGWWGFVVEGLIVFAIVFILAVVFVGPRRVWEEAEDKASKAIGRAETAERQAEPEIRQEDYRIAAGHLLRLANAILGERQPEQGRDEAQREKAAKAAILVRDTVCKVYEIALIDDQATWGFRASFPIETWIPMAQDGLIDRAAEQLRERMREQKQTKHEAISRGFQYEQVRVPLEEAAKALGVDLSKKMM